MLYSWTNVVNLLVYLGHTVWENTIMKDTKVMVEPTWEIPKGVQRVCEGIAYESLILLLQTCHAPPYIQYE